MRLLIISLNADPLLSFGTLHGGGQSKYVLELGKNLVGLGWSIDLLTLRNRGAPWVDQVTEDFNVHRISRTNNRDYDYDITVSEVEELADVHPEKLSFDRYRLVLCCYWLSGVYLIKADPKHQLPWIFTLSSLGVFKKAVDFSEEIRERIEVEKSLVQVMDFIISTNEAERHALEYAYEAQPSKLVHIPRGVKVEVFGEFTQIPFYR